MVLSRRGDRSGSRLITTGGSPKTLARSRCDRAAKASAPGGKAGFAAATQVIVQRRPEQAGADSCCQQRVTAHLPALQRPIAQIDLCIKWGFEGAV